VPVGTRDFSFAAPAAVWLNARVTIRNVRPVDVRQDTDAGSCFRLSATHHPHAFLASSGGKAALHDRKALLQTLSLFASAGWALIRLPAMALAALLALAGAHAADTWLTITGDPASSANHYIQVNAAAISIKDELRIIPVRINRATPWTAAGEGIQFRSVVTDVQIDCTQQTARYVKAAFYAQPDFRGEPFRVATYGGDDIRPMIFKDMSDDPNARIIKAACSVKNVTSN
jgi:hypothetical protein